MIFQISSLNSFSPPKISTLRITGTLIISISGGEWVSHWKLEGNSLQGTIKANAHYFEDGNVHFNEEKKVSEQLSLSRTPSEIDSDIGIIMKAILKLENIMQISLEQFYEQMPDTFFRVLRRALPVTNAKMEWSTQALKVIHNLKSQK